MMTASARGIGNSPEGASIELGSAPQPAAIVKSVWGYSRRFDDIRVMSAFPLIATE